MPGPTRQASLARRLAAIGAFADELATDGFQVGQWRGGERDEDGVIQMPWYELGERALRFVSALGGILEVFDWPSWAVTDEAKRLYADREVLAAATSEQLSKLATALIRSERFSDGELAAAFESGLMAAIAARAAVLAAELA